MSVSLSFGSTEEELMHAHGHRHEELMHGHGHGHGHEHARRMPRPSPFEKMAKSETHFGAAAAFGSELTPKEEKELKKLQKEKEADEKKHKPMPPAHEKELEKLEAKAGKGESEVVDPVAKIRQIIEMSQKEAADAMSRQLHITLSVTKFLVLLDAARTQVYSDEASGALNEVLQEVKVFVDTLIRLEPAQKVTLHLKMPDGTPVETEYNGEAAKTEKVERFEREVASPVNVLADQHKNLPSFVQDKTEVISSSQ